ncbi:hypothetical protein Q3G72_015354 [Acer saccharum]|nr:hypothetical protein Q3G72_015354 [Acer saccharum]
MVRARKNDDKEPPYDKHEERKANMNDLDLGDLYPNCLCGRRARLCTSWTNTNPRRRFWGYSNFRGDVNCGYFRWHDSPICERSKQIIPGLLRRIQELEMRMGESNDFEGNHEDVSYAAAMGTIKVEPCHTCGGVGWNWENTIATCTKCELRQHLYLSTSASVVPFLPTFRAPKHYEGHNRGTCDRRAGMVGNASETVVRTEVGTRSIHTGT